MHSLLNGSDADCVTSVDGGGVTGIEVDPIHGYVVVTLCIRIVISLCVGGSKKLPGWMTSNPPIIIGYITVVTGI